MRPLFATKPVDQLRADSEHSHGMKRSLTALDLVMLGVGGIIGTGIFVMTGEAAARYAGPAVVISFILAGIASALAGLCYAEMASMIPIAGSAYTYSYATLGELLAWVIGWDLVLEYLVGAATVSVGWSGYVMRFLNGVLGFDIGPRWTTSPIEWTNGAFHLTGAYLNVPAVLITAVITVILVVGIKESARFNTAIVFLKLMVILLFIAFVAGHIDTANWRPFIPENTGQRGHFGFSGIWEGASYVFFAYIGFDAVSTAAQETKNPQRDLPIGILGSLAICTVLYVAVAAILTGAVSYTKLGVPDPIAVGAAATGMKWLQAVVTVGAIAGLSSVMLVLLLGQPRIFFSMARDGLFFKWASRIHPRFGTPYKTTIVAGVLCAAAGGTMNVSILGKLTSIGTLFAFVLVCLGVMVLRRSRPDIPRRFRVPGGTYLVPLLGAGASLYLMAGSDYDTLVRLFAWMAIGLVIYFFYGRRHSALRASMKQRP